MNYRNFLEGKFDIAQETGFEVADADVNPALFPHQRDSVRWALRGGRRAVFAQFGLGKTVIELEWARLCAEHTGGRALIILPLGVKQEFARDAREILHRGEPPYVRTDAEAARAGANVMMTNYERVRDGSIDASAFSAVALDEAAVLRSYGSKTYQEFTRMLRGVPYKLVCTATPAPNRYKELIHYAAFLEVMDGGQALTRFFQRDSTKANNLTLYPHRVREFWLWMSSWALFLTKPSDLGYPDDGYILPEITVRWHRLGIDIADAGFDRHGQGQMFRDAALSLRDAAREKRESIDARVAKAKEIIAEDPDAHYIIWHDLEAERHAIMREITGAVEVYGTQDYEEREKRVIDFSEGRARILATKKEISGVGCNFQRHCHRAIFLGIDYEFHDFIQAVHRIHRFLQTETVVIDIIYVESEEEIRKALMSKWARHDELVREMEDIVKSYGLTSKARFAELARTIGVERVEVTGRHYRAINNDCVDEMSRMPDDSIDEIVTSIPFGNHYEYTPSYNDFGHNPDTKEFFEQMDFLTPNLLRALKPGRVFCCHVKDRVLFGNATGTGMPTLEPFHALCIQHYMKHGFQYFGMITVITDVVRENNQTYRLGWTECCKDGTKMGVGCPEYILLFRKLPTDTTRAYADAPVSRDKDEYTRAQWQIDAHAFWRSSGDRRVTKDELLNAPVSALQKLYRKYSRDSVYSYGEHVALAKKLDAENKLPATFMVCAPGSWQTDVWDDINRMRTYNTTQSQRRQQMHVCPLQIDIVRRLIDRYSNPGDAVLDPFGGIMTVPAEAVLAGRDGIGIELSADYFRDGVGYLQQADEKRGAPTLFDILEAE